jgi:Homeodomain-like domain
MLAAAALQPAAPASAKTYSTRSYTCGARAPDQGARFEVHLEKARGVYGDDAKPFEARLETTDGADYWHVTSLEDANEDRVIEATKEGLSSREIAKELGICKSTVNNIRRRHKFRVIDGGKDVATGQPPNSDGQMASQEKGDE